MTNSGGYGGGFQPIDGGYGPSGVPGQPQPGYPNAGPTQQYPTAPQYPAGQQYAATATHGVAGPGFGPPAGPPPPPKSNKKMLGLIIGGVAALVVVVLVVVTLVLVLGGGEDKAGSAKEAVSTYLHALADGDAEKALSVVKTPPTTTLLTNEVLKRQQDIAKITDIKVFDSNGGLVKATYKFGTKNADVDILVSKSGGEWQLTNGALEINTTYLRIPQPTLFGVDVSNDSKVYVFPGPLVWGSKNQYIAVSNPASGDFPLGPEGYVSISSTEVKATLSESGKTAVSNAVNTYLTNCAGSRQMDASIDKPGCEQESYSSAKPGTVRWTKPTDLSRLDASLGYDNDLKVRVSGIVEWGLTYVPTYDDAPRNTTSSDYMSGKVDLTQNPPTYTAGS
uniref:hypothetical protein n=1 Tax=Gordonia sp. B7-2 TaxID=3420932 RepID=UPI003D93B623